MIGWIGANRMGGGKAATNIGKNNQTCHSFLSIANYMAITLRSLAERGKISKQKKISRIDKEVKSSGE